MHLKWFTQRFGRRPQPNDALYAGHCEDDSTLSFQLIDDDEKFQQTESSFEKIKNYQLNETILLVDGSKLKPSSSHLEVPYT